MGYQWLSAPRDGAIQWSVLGLAGLIPFGGSNGQFENYKVSGSKYSIRLGAHKLVPTALKIDLTIGLNIEADYQTKTSQFVWDSQDVEVRSRESQVRMNVGIGARF